MACGPGSVVQVLGGPTTARTRGVMVFCQRKAHERYGSPVMVVEDEGDEVKSVMASPEHER
jgi:hypothetical protein